MINYQIDTIVKGSIVNTVTTNSVDQAIYYFMRAQQYCLTSIAKLYEIENGTKRELAW